MSILSYYPEMGEAKPADVQGNITLSRDGKHWFIETPLSLKGRGILFEQVLQAKNLTERGQYKAGWAVYRVTRAAMNTLVKEHNFAREALLD